MLKIIDKYRFTGRKLLLFFAFLIGAVLISPQTKAQSDGGINYSVALDTNVIVIGDQIHLQLTVEQPKQAKIGFPVFSDSIVNGVEILNQTPQDTIQLDKGKIKVNKQFLITSFDGGVYKLKPFEFQILGQNGTKVIRTDTLLLGVKTMQIDTTKGNFDIVMPIDTPLSFAEMAPWILGGLVCIAIIAFLIWYFRFRKKDQPLFAVTKQVEPAHVIALRRLDEIKHEKLWQSGKVKKFHSDLTDTLRFYFDERFDLATQESTTDEILQAVANVDTDQKWHSNLREILERADLAKFAKFTPLPDENERSLNYAYQIIESTILAEPQEKNSEEESNPEMKLEENK